MRDSITGIDTFDGVIDLIDSGSDYDEREGDYTLKLKPTNNDITDRMEGLKLRDLKLSYQQYFRQVEYVINRVPDTAEAVSLLILLFIMQKELQNATYQLTKTIADVAGGAFGFAVAAAKIVAAAAYFFAVIYSMYILLEELSDAIFSKIKRYYVIRISDLIEVACNHIGWAFESNLFDGEFKKLVILPSTIEEGVTSGIPANNPIPNTNLLDFLNNFGKVMNAKTKINNLTKTIEFKNKFDYIDNPSSLILDDLYRNGRRSYNLGELPKEIKISFLKDTLETNTYLKSGALGINLTGQEITSDGNNINVTYNIKGSDPETDMLNGELDVSLIYARGYRKEFVSNLEKIFNTIYDLIGAIKTAAGSKNTASSSKIGDRKGRLLLSGDFIGASKIFLLEDNRLVAKESYLTVHAENLFNKFYVREGIDQNQQYIYTERDNQEICNKQQENEIRYNNVASDSNGNTVILTKNVKDSYTGLHEIEYRRFMKAGDQGFVESSEIEINKEYSE